MKTTWRKIHERIDAFPTHRWVGRLLPFIAAYRFYTAGFNFDSFVLMYLWWLSEVTADESWMARRAIAKESDS